MVLLVVLALYKDLHFSRGYNSARGNPTATKDSGLRCLYHGDRIHNPGHYLCSPGSSTRSGRVAVGIRYRPQVDGDDGDETDE